MLNWSELPDLPDGACSANTPPTEMSAGSGVYRWTITWEGQPAILLAARREGAGHDRLRALTQTHAGLSATFRRELVIRAQSNAWGSWIVLAHAADALSRQSTSITVDARARPGTGAECLEALNAALDALEILDADAAERLLAPSGIDWIARDEQGRWLVNALDPGLWSVGDSRDWRHAAYDVVWAVALGRSPTMRDAPAYELIVAQKPSWLSTAMARLIGHRGEVPRSIAEARSLLRDSRSGARIRTALTLGCLATALLAATIWWIDQRIVAKAHAIAARTEDTPFERRDELAALVADHPLLMFGRGAARELRDRLISECSNTTAGWREEATEALNKPPTNTSEFSNELHGLITRAEPFQHDVTEIYNALRRRLSEVRAELVLAANDVTLVALVDAANELRAQGSTSSALLKRLGTAFDELRWKKVGTKPNEQASTREFDLFLESLTVYKADVQEDAIFGGKIRGYSAEADLKWREAVEQREQPQRRQLDEWIEKGKKAENFAIAADVIIQLLGERYQTPNMREHLLGMAKNVQRLQKTKLADMKRRGEPLPDRAKAILDWKNVVTRHTQAFPTSDLDAMVRDMAEEFAGSIYSAKSPDALPAASPSLRGVLGLVDGTLEHNLLRAHGLRDQWVRNERTPEGDNQNRMATWILQKHYPNLARDGKRVVQRKVSGISFELRATVEDHWGSAGNDWIAKVEAVGSFQVDQPNREVAADLSSPIIFRFRIRPGDDFYFVDGDHVKFTVWDDNYGLDDPILLDGKIVFGNQITIQVLSGDKNAVHITLIPIP